MNRAFLTTIIFITIFTSSMLLANDKIDLKFVINEEYLITHILQKKETTSSEIIQFKNSVWKLAQSDYQFILKLDRINPEQTDLLQLDAIKNLIVIAKNLKEYKSILAKTVEHQKSCQDQWNKNYEISLTHMKNISRLQFNRSFTVYITHPDVPNGMYLGQNSIAWGNTDRWDNYFTIFIWHEILHSYLSLDKVSHAVIELATDNELRKRLNQTDYLPSDSHSELAAIRLYIYTNYWQEYLNNQNLNIIEFSKLVKSTIESNHE